MTCIRKTGAEGEADAQAISWPAAILNPLTLITGIVLSILALFQVVSPLVYGGVMISMKTLHILTYLGSDEIKGKTKLLLLAIYLFKVIMATLTIYQIVSLEVGVGTLLGLDLCFTFCVWPEGICAPCVKCPPKENSR